MSRPRQMPFEAEIRFILAAAMLLFVYTVVVGILNGLDLVEFGRRPLLAHLHVGLVEQHERTHLGPERRRRDADRPPQPGWRVVRTHRARASERQHAQAHGREGDARSHRDSRLSESMCSSSSRTLSKAAFTCG